MRILRFIISGGIAPALVLILAATYVFLTIRSETPWGAMAVLLKDHVIVRGTAVLLSLHLFLKGVHRLWRGRTERAASSILLVSLSLFLAGILVSLTSREVESKRLSPSDGPFREMKLLEITAVIPEKALVIGETTDFTIKGLTAKIAEAGETVTVVPFPFRRTSSGYVYVNDGGISPSLDLRIGSEKSTISKLDLLPPGKKAEISVPSRHTLRVSLSAEREFKKGRLTAREYNLLFPAYDVIVKEGERVVVETSIREGEKVSHEDFLLQCGKTEPWVELVVVRDHAVVLLYGGIIGLVVGSLLYPVEFIRRLRRKLPSEAVESNTENSGTR